MTIDEFREVRNEAILKDWRARKKKDSAHRSMINLAIKYGMTRQSIEKILLKHGAYKRKTKVTTN